MRDGRSTPLYAVDTVDTVDMVYSVDTIDKVYTVDMDYTHDMVYSVYMVHTVDMVYTDDNVDTAELFWTSIMIMDGWMERLGRTPYTVMTVTNIAAVANDRLWELNHFTLFTLLKQLTLLSLTLCMTHYSIMTAWVIRNWKI